MNTNGFLAIDELEAALKAERRRSAALRKALRAVTACLWSAAMYQVSVAALAADDRRLKRAKAGR